MLTDREENAAQARLREAALLPGSKSGAAAEFMTALLGNAAPEDLLRYSPKELAVFAAPAFAHFEQRIPGTPSIRVETPAAVARLEAVTVIEIINDDMPFLLDSVLAELKEQTLSVQLVAHPILKAERNREGRLTGWSADAAYGKGRRESFIHIHVERIDPALAERVRESLQAVLAEVRLAVADWREMVGRAHAAIEELKSSRSPLPEEEVAEAAAFLEWLAADNFTFLGCREYSLADGAERELLEPVFATGRGILRNRDLHVLRRGGEPVTSTPQLHEFLQQPVQLIITKANVRSRVHRRVHMDYVGVKRFDGTGRVVGEFRIVGLFTSSAYTRRAGAIPYLRRKIDKVLDRAGFDPETHSGKALVNVLETYPRDELFQIDDETLYRFAQEILQLEVRPRVRVLVRADKFDRFVSVLLYVPRERYDSAVRVKIGAYLADIFKGRVSAFYPTVLDGPLTRVHFIIGRDGGTTPTPDRGELESAVEEIVRDWSDGLASALLAAHDVSKARMLERRYRGSFQAGYQETFAPDEAMGDIRVLESLTPESPIAVEFYRGTPDPAQANLKIWSYGRPLPLSERVPVLEHMGFTVIDERTFAIEATHERPVREFLHDMLLVRAGGGEADLATLGGRLESALMAVLRGQAENDGYNALVLAAGLPWRDVALVRTLSRCLRQTGIAYSQDYLWTTVVRHAAIAAQIVALYHLRFDPRIEIEPEERAARESEVAVEIESALATVQSLDDDRILRRFTNLVRAAIRTNFYQLDADEQAKPTIAVKFDSRKIDSLPAPRPMYEIFVYSPRVEGVHLRFGKVARGGIRWSDRPQDFRTEILGLVKAQQVKNAVIVPFGAKGGFVPKRLPAGGGRAAIMAEGTASYEIFIASLLDLTDNRGPQGIVPPLNTLRYDGDDPYLVVAADKGTATFSDIANGIALRHGFWLGDAFASGGSAGYDHKKMGITARGAWEAVRRHFRETDVDIRTQPFTVAGVGDMSGDVFGNGMLREKTIKLVAAFDHRDIFLDPDPDPEQSWAERKRLFDLPRSSWQDYDRTLISPGGGVFPRSAKSIPVADAVRELLGIETTEATPHQLMRALLRAPVDLLWFGGIGTYVRSSGETDDDAGDKANDAIRIAATELQARVIGEGANLGMTQRGRVEAAMRGVRLNTDAIDNSAGVNTSDVEVNLKIALATPIADKRLMPEGRNALLAEMTDEVAALVLRNNYLQTLAISLAARRGLEDLGFQNHLMRNLERRGVLDRAVEFLPADLEIAERRAREQGLTRPELAVLLAYAKISLFGDLLESDVPNDPYLARELGRYFPKEVAERYPGALEEHRLRREIIATMLANSMINRGGPSFIARVGGETGEEAPTIAKAFAAVRDAYRMTDLNGEIDRLDAKVPGDLQLSLYGAVQNLLLDRVNWFLRHADLRRGLAELVGHYRGGIEAVAAALDAALAPEQDAAWRSRAAELVAGNVPEALARTIARLPALTAAPDIVLIADDTGQPIEAVAAVYFPVAAHFRLDRIAEAARRIEAEDHFDRLALDRALADIASSQRGLTAEALATGERGAAAVAAWVASRGRGLERTRTSVHEIAGSGLSVSKLVVAVGLLADLVKK